MPKISVERVDGPARRALIKGLVAFNMAAAGRLDFLEEDVLRGYLKDRHGRYGDLVIMVKNFHRDWSDF